VGLLLSTELLCLFVLGLIGVLGVLDRADDQRSVSPMLFLGGFIVLFFVVKPIVNLVVRKGAFSGAEITALDPFVLTAVALGLCLVGVIFLYFGYVTRLGRAVANSLPRWEFGRGSWLSLIAVLLAYDGLLVLENAYVLFSLGGFPGLTNVARSEMVGTTLGKAGFTILLCGKFFFAITVICLLKPGLFARTGGSVRALKAVALVTALIIAMSLYLAGSRTRFFELVIVAVVVYSLLVRPLRVRTLVAFGGGLVIAATLIYPAVFLFILLSGQASGEQVDILSRILLSQQRLGDKIDTLMVLVDRMYFNGDWLLGRSSLGFLGQFLTFLPRDQGPFIHETQFFVRTYFPVAASAGLGYPVPFFANMFWNFGVVGVAVGGYALGLASRIFYDYMKARVDWGVAIYGSMVFSLYGFFGGSLSQAIAYNAVTMIAGLGALTWITRGRWQQRVDSADFLVPTRPGS
jgi:hypothetical protein